MNKSETIAALATALNLAQKDMKPAKMASVNPFLKNKYADLGEIIQASRVPLSNYGLSFSQLVTTDNGNIGVETVLLHKSGEWLSSTISLPIGDEKGRSLAQSAGAIITYLRRYSLAAILGIYADEDTDGEKGESSNGKPTQVQEKQPKPNGKKITPEMQTKYRDLAIKAFGLDLIDSYQTPTDYEAMVKSANDLKEMIAEFETTRMNAQTEEG